MYTTCVVQKTELQAMHLAYAPVTLAKYPSIQVRNRRELENILYFIVLVHGPMRDQISLVYMCLMANCIHLLHSSLLQA